VGSMVDKLTLAEVSPITYFPIPILTPQDVRISVTCHHGLVIGPFTI
jgi:hypothetical protein